MAHRPLQQYTTDRCLSRWDLRRLFNEGRFELRAERGEFQVTIPSNNDLPPHKIATIKRLKPGAKTQTIIYLDTNGNLAVEIHCYRNLDNTLGGSGHLDPTTLIIKGVKYHRAFSQRRRA